jgi:hypothetical protein
MRQKETEKTDKKDGEHAVSCINTTKNPGIINQQSTRCGQFQV